VTSLEQQLDPQFFALQEALAGKYSLDAELGRGGMGVVYLAHEVRLGVVYLAHEVRLDRPVALKVLPQEFSRNAELRERFLREARTAARLSHPNIVPIFTVDEVGEFVYFAMAYVAGESLGQRVRSRGPLPPSEGARVLKEVGWALAYAHSQGIVHRDVKPDNILLEEGTGRALVADFGIAGLLKATAATGVGEIIGTAEFMSPEQAGGQGVDARSDTYSMGVVGFYALSGNLPFRDERVVEVLRQHREDPAPPLKSVASHVPSRLARCVDRCLAKEPAARFETAAAFSDAVDVAIRQRSDVPVPVRNFIKDPIDLPGDGVTYFVFSIAMVTPAVFIALEEGAVSFLSAFVAAYGAFILAPPITLAIQRIRRLLASGHTLADLQAALRTEVERRREELAYGHGVEVSSAEKIAFRVAAVAGGGLLASFAAFFGLLPNVDAWMFVYPGSVLAGTVSLAVGTTLRARRIDQKAERRFKFWKGTLAKWLFQVAGIGLKPKALSMRPTHRPTELQIGFAVDALYEQLPKDIRSGLGDVSSVVRQLEADAQRLRQTLEMLNDAHVTARAAGGEIPADLRDARETTEQHLASAVSALETIRLGLLRLTAGTGTVEGLTTDLAAAADVGDAIDRIMAGMTDVELLLRPT
jgi:serine/threonine-protein kinase